MPVMSGVPEPSNPGEQYIRTILGNQPDEISKGDLESLFESLSGLSFESHGPNNEGMVAHAGRILVAAVHQNKLGSYYGRLNDLLTAATPHPSPYTGTLSSDLSETDQIERLRAMYKELGLPITKTVKLDAFTAERVR